MNESGQVELVNGDVTSSVVELLYKDVFGTQRGRIVLDGTPHDVFQHVSGLWEEAVIVFEADWERDDELALH